jgi:hypothetical protein
MFYYLYEIRNNLNGKIYVGVHKTKSLDDGYMGSGKVIQRAITKHGVENFTKVVLEYFENAEAMYAREKEVVTDEFLLREDTYNLKRGGNGGFDYINTSGKNLYNKNGTAGYGKENLIHGDEQKAILIKNGTFNQHCKNISNSMKKFIAENGNWWIGRPHSIETKEKIGKANSEHQTGSGNSQFGTCWIQHELLGTRKCKKELLPEYIEQGWIKGRK